jgi:membrane protease YdiL (CAAX protease family)
VFIEALLNAVILISALLLIYNGNGKSFSLSQGLIHPGYFLLVGPIIVCFTLGNLIVNTIIVILISIKLKIKLVNIKLSFVNFDYLKSIIKNITIIWPILMLVSLVSKTILYEYSEQEIVRNIRISNNSTELLSMFIMIVILAPIIEEIIFRGLIYRVFKRLLGPLFGAFISSILFSFVHLNLLSFSYLFIFGIILCVYYEKEKTIITPIIMHSILNGIMFSLILNK